MEPPYQRSANLWSTRDKSFLIDSIINGFDIPKIYIADFTYKDSPLNEKKLPYAVIDGKQRLESIFDFFDGRLTLDDGFEFLENRELRLGGLGYADLKARHPKIASRFENYNIYVMSVITDEEGKINELFVRLNRSQPLTGAEKRNAMKGHVPHLIRSLANHDFFRRCVKFGIARGQDKNAAAKLLLIEFIGKFAETKRRQLDAIVEEGVRSESPGIDRSAERVRHVLDRMGRVFSDKDPLLGSQGPVVLYYELIKSSNKEDEVSVREFLVRFERLRTQVRKGQIEDPEMLEYDVMKRSLNNTSSQVRCYAILSKRFRSFLQAGTVKQEVFSEFYGGT